MQVAPGPPRAPSIEPTVQTDALFGKAIRLRGYSVSRAPFSIKLHWQSESEVDRSYAVFLHLLGPDGAIAAQSDGPPAAGRAPTDGWSPGDRIDDSHQLAAPPGQYRLRVGLYDPVMGQRLTLPGGADHLDLGTISVE